ncbi:MAG TPA: M56 family metallopeptidase [Glaciihabitans sp.]|jgi:Zn-dependent protease with chaperone function|nr:M56 family metallopeptidase [Glaciihabitans sp.]
MLTASLLLAALAIALAWPVPVVLARAQWTSTAPATALLLWQAIALAGGLSMIGSLLTFGLIPFGDNLVSAALNLATSVFERSTVPSADIIHLVALCGALLLGVHLVLNLILTAIVTHQQRRRHRQLVELLSSPLPDQPNTRLIDHNVPVAYCLPGTHHSVTVFSAGLVRLLNPNELRAVIEHEKAHLTQRHYVVLMAFDAWRTSLPWFPIATRAQRQVGMLVEMLADDQARRHVEDRTLATAIALVSAGAAPESAAADLSPLAGPSVSAAQLNARVQRLLGGHAPLPLAGRVGVVAGAIALVAVPTVLLLSPALATVAALG